MSDTNGENQLRLANTKLNRRIALLEETLLKKENVGKALQDSEKRYRRLFESAKDGILILDAETGKVVDVNPFLLQLFGYSNDAYALIGKHIWELGVFKDVVASKDAFKVLQENEYIRYKDLPLKTHDGQSIDMECVSNVYLVEHSKVIQCNIRDITAHKQAKDDLNRFFDFIPDMLCIISTDGFFKKVNKAWELVLGYSQEELLAMPCKDLIHPDHINKTLAEIEKQIADGSTKEFVNRFRCKDGSYRWFAWLTAPASDKTLLFASARDITEHMQAEAEHMQLMTAIEQAGEGILITDAQGIIQFVNPAFERTTGYSRDEAMSQNPRILKSGEQDEQFYHNLWDTISSGGTWAGRMVNKRKDGTLYTEESTISPVRDNSGLIVNYVAVKRDITKNLRLSAQFQQSQKMEAIGLLAGGVAHDYNNILTVILGYTELALKKIDPGQPVHNYLQQINKAAIRSTDITRQLLAFARKQTIVPVVLDLNQAVESMLKMLRRLIGEDIDLVWLPEVGLSPVKIDPVQVDQILANLCVNARDAIADVGKVTIETGNAALDETYCAHHAGFVPGEYVLLAVSDDGCGMDKETLDQIFEPFFTTKEMGHGTGLGLSTVYGIVKQNNGFINIYSEPGKGTTFRIYLPPCVGQAVDTQWKMAEGIPLSGGETVLVVEDESDLLEMAKMMLEKLGYRVLAAGTPGEAIGLAEEHASEIHLLITDVVMPVMNGWNLAERLKALYPSMKILFMSGYTAAVISQREVLLEGVNFIQKPFSMSGLAAKVQEALQEK